MLQSLKCVKIHEVCLYRMRAFSYACRRKEGEWGKGRKGNMKKKKNTRRYGRQREAKKKGKVMRLRFIKALE